MKVWRKYIVKHFTRALAVLFVLSLCSIDSVSFFPTITLIASGVWLTIYAWANGYMDGDAE